MAVAKGVLALLGLIFLLLAGFRVAAEIREGEVAAPAKTVRFPTRFGTVAAQVSGPADGRTVMIVHGTAAWSGFWKDVSAHLASRGWRVIAVDLPPFGWSDRDPQGRYDRVTQSQRLAELLAAARTEHAVVVAHSFGAGPATELALRHPEQLSALILVDAALGELNPSDETTAAKALRLRPVAELVTSATVTNPDALGPLLRSMVARKDRTRSWLPVLREPMRRDGTTSAYAAWLPNLFARQDRALSRRSSNLRNIRIPVALVWGEADTVTPLEQGERLAALTRARSIEVVPGVGHIPHIEDPQRFVEALDAALGHVNEGKR